MANQDIFCDMFMWQGSSIDIKHCRYHGPCIQLDVNCHGYSRGHVYDVRLSVTQVPTASIILKPEKNKKQWEQHLAIYVYGFNENRFLSQSSQINSSVFVIFHHLNDDHNYSLHSLRRIWVCLQTKTVIRKQYTTWGSLYCSSKNTVYLGIQTGIQGVFGCVGVLMGWACAKVFVMC